MTALAALLVVAALAGCAPEAHTAGSPDSSPTVAPSQTPAEPTATDPPATMLPQGTAADNLPVFAGITASVWASEGRASGRAYVDALAAAGFDKASMEVTDDLSTVGNAAESIQFSVRWGDECLIGQVGAATGDPVTVVEPVLVEGTCLVGETRPLDW